MDDLAGRVAVITGGASGIGLAMAERFAAEGMRIVLADVERPVLERAAAQLADAGVEVLAVPTDVSVAADVEALAAATLEHFGDVHLLCNNAGVGSRGLPVIELPLADFEWVVGVNLFGVIHGLQAFLPRLVANDVGHIVNTASTSAFSYLPRMGPYNATKAAVVALSETLRFELEAEGSHVGVSVLCPSWVRTNISTSDRNRPERFAYTLDADQSPGGRVQGQAAPAGGDAGDGAGRRRRAGVPGGEGRPLLHLHPPRERRAVRRAGRADRRRSEP